jgi:hypothetical protein
VISCGSGSVFKCKDGSPAHYPNFVVCGSFIGFAKLTDERAAQTGSFNLPGDTEIYPDGFCGKENPPEALGRCYYDGAPEAVLHSAAPQGLLKEFGMSLSFSQTQSFNVHYVAADTGVKGCAKAGILDATGKGQQGFCAGYITCRGGPSHFKVCRASGQSACPTAEECDGENSNEFPMNADTRLDWRSPYYEDAPKGAKVSNMVVAEPGIGPMVVRSKDGKAGACIVPIASDDPTIGSLTFSVASAVADKDGCPKTLKEVFKDKCVNPHVVKIQTYGGKIVYPVAAPASDGAKEAQ